MSSAPSGLDVREYAYCMYQFKTPDGLTYEITTQNQWLVTKIQAYAGPGGSVFLTPAGSGSLEIAADSCATLEPNGAHRGTISFGGTADSLIVVEFWFQARSDGNFPLVTRTP